MAEDVSEGDAGAKFTPSGIGCRDAEWKGCRRVAAGGIFTSGFIVINRGNSETEEMGDISLGCWGTEGILSQTCQ